MVEMIPPPDPHRLLPPVLACLPIAFASRRPPPALLLLVSPILRQRLQLNTSTPASPSGNWLRLLCWDQQKADDLHVIVENCTFEPHPSSGEIEIGYIGEIKYKRLDQESLRAQIVLSGWGLAAIYLWCSEGEESNEWKLAELLPYDTEMEGDLTWSRSIFEANETSRERLVSQTIQDAEAAEQATAGKEEDDDYWAQYDKTPGRTSTETRSPMPNGTAADRPLGNSESEYYSQYREVQPAMDNHDPSEESNDTGDFTVRGDILASAIEGQAERMEDQVQIQRAAPNMRTVATREVETPVGLPQPSPPQRAGQQSAPEIGVRQHICSTVKSLSELANSAGIEQEEFNRIIQRELGIDSILDG